jgi:hypothetical protein
LITTSSHHPSQSNVLLTMTAQLVTPGKTGGLFI